QISVRIRQSGEKAQLVVSDTGTGIAAAELPHIFERFHRVPGAHGRTHEGTGIGLALVQELVKLHGGSVSVHSEVGRGTTFIITIPFGSAHLPPDRIGATRSLTSTAITTSPFVEEALRWLPDDIAPGAAAIADAPVTTEGDRVLLADDNADMR